MSIKVNESIDNIISAINYKISYLHYTRVVHFYYYIVCSKGKQRKNTKENKANISSWKYICDVSMIFLSFSEVPCTIVPSVGTGTMSTSVPVLCATFTYRSLENIQSLKKGNEERTISLNLFISNTQDYLDLILTFGLKCFIVFIS